MCIIVSKYLYKCIYIYTYVSITSWLPIFGKIAPIASNHSLLTSGGVESSRFGGLGDCDNIGIILRYHVVNLFENSCFT
jgi:hypothetical protein